MRVLSIGLLAAIPLFAQNSLILSSGGSALNLTLNSHGGVRPAAIQWTLTYSPNELLSVQAVVAGSAAAAGKTISCAGATGSYRCLLAGTNSTVISDGVVAVVTVAAAAGVAASALGITNMMGATSDGFALVVTGTGGTAATAGVATSPSGSVPPATAPALSGLSCVPGSLAAATAATCTVTLSGPGGGTVTLASNNPALSVPPAITVVAGSTTATFAATAGNVATGQTATVTARLNGASQSVSITLLPALTITSLACTPSTLGPGASSVCTVTLSRTGGGTITLSSSNTAVAIPPAVTVAAASTSATFSAIAGAIASSQSASVTARLNASTQTALLVLQPATQATFGIASLNCVPDLSAAGSLYCAIQLTRGAPDGGVQVTIQSSSARLQPPAPIRIPAGQQNATFAMHVVASDQDAQPQVTASMPGAARTISVSITGARPTAVILAAATIAAGTRLSGEIPLNPSNVPDFVKVALSTTNANLRLPASITFRPGQTRATFQISADPRAREGDAEILAQFGQTVARAPLAVSSSRSPFLIIPHEITARFGEVAAFTASAFDPQGLPVVYSLDTLPEGASFDAATGSFSWTPEPSQAAVYEIAVTATNSESAAATARVKITVDSGAPVITGIYNAAGKDVPACSPGALASVEGRWLATGSDPVADPSGASAELGGVRVTVNGKRASVVYASARRIDFVCPALEPGNVAVSVENASGAAGPAPAVMAAIAPALFTLDGSGAGQGIVYLAGSSELAASRDDLALGEPAQAGDAVVLRATGIGSPSGPPPVVMVGGLPAQVASVGNVSGMAGIVEITVLVPAGVAEGDRVPVYLVFRRLNVPAFVRGERQNLRLRSNWVTIAVESGR
jgi:uncharacterized protein (TIGR03437 family)